MLRLLNGLLKRDVKPMQRERKQGHVASLNRRFHNLQEELRRFGDFETCQITPNKCSLERRETPSGYK